MRSRLLLPLLLTVTSACAVGPRFTPPAVSMPSTWPEHAPNQASQPTHSLERWWTQFHDPVLDSLVSRAVEGNLELQIAAARIRESRAARGIAAAAALPQVDASANYARTQRSDAVPPFNAESDARSPFGARQQNVFEAGFDASWEIDVFGGVRHDKDAALAQAQATEETRRDVLVTLLADVARAYIELRGVQRQLAILDQTLRSQEDTLSLVRARMDAGLATDFDVARAEGLVATTISERPVRVRETSQAMHRLGVLLGQEPGALMVELATPMPMPPTPDVPSTLPSELLSRRPDLRRAERELAAAAARVGVARADLFPRFSLRGNFGRRSDDLGDLGSLTGQFWSLVPGVRWPVLSGGRIRANIRVHDARQEQASREYEQAILIALQEVADALVAHAREQERLTALQTAATANRRALDVSLDRYTGGLESFLSVLDAQRSVYESEDALVRSERSLALGVIAVYKSLGGGWTPNAALTPEPESSSRERGSR